MTNTPIFSKLDADRILKRAAEIEGSEEARPLTADELRSIAREAGFGAQAIDRAISEAQRAATEVHRLPVHRSGLIFIQLSTARSLHVHVSSDQLMTAVRLFQPYREGAAQVKLEEDRITWRDRKGIRFTVTSAAGVVEIQVFVSKILMRRGRWMGQVKSAADRLETLIRLVATRGTPGADLLTRLPKGPRSEADTGGGSQNP